ncbi:glucokinase [Actinocorallia herbida]|uniref:Glucokinase n=1 Tax=Actinocorallia herbida TaxID=58109 RepID=A0A3N1CRA2_9ACTN|nr:ROK family glucokinase [Actinocorallia herbida]ROO83846.1 glucokinase [Actinocorallia herbida]
MSLTIGVDVGGTKVAAGVVDDQGRILEKLRRPTPSTNPELTAGVIAEVTNLLKAKYADVSAVGLGAAGFVDETRSVVLFAANLAWRDEPLKQKVEKLTGLPVVVENDANAMAWGEYRFGAGRGEEHVVCVTLGTGIGGGIIVDGRLYRGRHGIGAELGHVRVVPDGRRCGCGNRGCWEQYASGNALSHEARDLARVEPGRAARMMELSGGTVEITGLAVSQAAHEGDPAALECFDTVADWAGQGLADLTATLDPALFIIGGGLSAVADLFLDRMTKVYTESVTGRGHRGIAEIRIAELGADAGIVGAADLARQQ